MGEGEWPQRTGEHSRFRQRVGVQGRGLRVQAADARDMVQGGVRAEHRDGAGHLDGVAAGVPGPGEDRGPEPLGRPAAEPLGGAIVGRLPLVLQPAQDLSHVQRIAVGDLPARGDERRGGGHLQPILDEPRDGGRAERRRPQYDGVRVGGQRRRLAPGHQQDERQPLEALRQVREETQRGVVGPLRVVDDQQRRAARGHACTDGAQGPQHARGWIGGQVPHRVAGRQHARRLSCLAGEERVAELGHRRRQGAADDPVRIVAFELGPGRGEHAQRRIRGDAGGGGQQGGLADPRGSLHEHQRAVPALRGRQPRGELVELRVALEEGSHAGRA